MRSRRYGGTLALAVAGALAFAGVASADTIGSTTLPSGASSGQCFSGFVVLQQVSPTGTPYQIASNGDTVTGWQINTATPNATAGAHITFVVLHPTSATTYDVVGADSQTLPNPLPAGGIASYTLATPIVASAGDTLGLYSDTPGVDCFFFGGATPAGGHLDALTENSTPAAGQHLTEGGPGPSPDGYELNVAATITPATEDAGVATAASPASVPAGGYALLSSTVTNAGPGSLPITFTDHVPAGLTVAAAATPGGNCTTAGQTVTCTVAGLQAGQSAPVTVVVATSTPGTYTNVVNVANPNDANPANNAASASFTVTAAAPAPKCVVPNLKRVPSSTAKKILKLLGCAVGRTKKAHSSSVAKGLVIRTSPKAGTYAAGRTVSLTVSTGKAKKKR